MEVNNNHDDERNRILKNLENDKIRNAMEELKNENFKNITHNIYVTICALIIFISLFLLDQNHLVYSTLIVLGIILLHFKFQILTLIYQGLNINVNKNKTI